MGLVPTVKMQKGTAVITVNKDAQSQWEKDGFKPVGEPAPVVPPPPEPETDTEPPTPPESKRSKK